MKQEKVLNKLNNIKSILIILIVLSSFFCIFRVGSQKIEYILKILNSFCIPLLVFVVGYFSRREKKDDYLKLIIFYLIGNTILMLYSFFVYDKAFNLVVPYYSFWFIISLIFWNIFVNKFGNIKGIFIFSIILSLLVGFFDEINTTLSLSYTICYLPFFILGFKINDELINKMVECKKIFKIIFGIISMLVGFVILFKFASNFTLDDTYMYPYLKNSALINRILIIVADLFLIIFSLLLSPEREIPFFTKLGKNFLYVIIYHSIFTLVITSIVPDIPKSLYYMIISLASTIPICFIFGSNKVKNITDILYNKIINLWISKKRKFVKLFTCAIIISILCIPTVKEIIEKRKNQDIIYNTITLEEQKKLDKSVSILFAGDLILLKNQIEGAYNNITNEYDFDPMFDYAKKYISNADLSIGVFEGVMAGESKGYTNTSLDNMDDDIFVNYPDEFGNAVKDAGFDLVTLSNNHLLDKGKKGAYRTADVLNKIGLDYTGIYKNKRNNVKIIEVGGVRIGVLAYTYNLAYHNDKEAINEEITPILVSRISREFSKVKSEVENDFKELKKQNPDVIVVLPHMGTQFTGEVDYFQQTWNEIFIENGATVILGDHSHHVQPIEYRKNKNGQDVLIVNSPGNFVNSFTRYNGDATSMVEVYLDKNDAEVIGCSVIPMWTYSPLEGIYKALPINDVMKNSDLRSNLSSQDLERIEEVYSLTTKTMINKELPISNTEERLYYSKDGYKRGKVPPLEVTEDERNSKLYKLIENSDSVMFIGDSVTEGTMNGGYAWYEPLMSNFNDKKIIDVSQGSSTVKIIANKYMKEKKEADLYIFAIGTNDVRYRDKSICAMNEDEYIKSLSQFIDKIPNKDDANFVFIAPWWSTDEDKVMKNEKLKNDLNKKYSKKLEEFCLKNNYLYINANNILKNTFEKESSNKYLVDYIHPNSNKGIYLYSKSVLDATIIDK